MNRSYSLNPVCPKFIRISEYFEKSKLEFSRFYCTLSLIPKLSRKISQNLPSAAVVIATLRIKPKYLSYRFTPKDPLLYKHYGQEAKLQPGYQGKLTIYPICHI